MTRAEITGTPTRGYRPELQGLRALAVVLVVIYHVYSDRISGGVDVFFLLSGFLLTGQLVRAAERGRLDLPRQWGRTLTRLVPAAAVVLAATAVAAYLILPPERWFQTIREVFAAAVFLENWRLGADSVDYFARNDLASPVQHFWSLSVQAQIMLLLPLLIALLLRRRGGLRRRVGLALGMLTAASLTYSVVLTATDQPFAYFNTFTRVWEFALGGLLALVVDAITLSQRLRRPIGWFGILALISCGLIIDVGTVFPGYAALWPTLAAALVIISGDGVRVLSARPLVRLGDLSYSLYLWHWPVLVLYLVARGGDQVGWRGSILVIGAALMLATLTHRLVEQPTRLLPATRWGAYRFAALLLVPVLALATSWQALALRDARYSITIGSRDYPGAQAMIPGFQYRGADDLPPMPPRIALPQDWATLDDLDCTRAARNPDLEMCSTSTMDKPAKTVVLVGDSHMQQYLAAVRPIAAKRNWRVVAMLKGLCPFSTASESMPGDQPCVDWNAAAAAEIINLKPDAVLTLASRDVRIGRTEVTPPGFVEQWKRLAAANIPVVALRDNPRFDHWPSTCAYELGPDAPDCVATRADLYPEHPPYLSIPDIPANVSFVDLSDYLCAADGCPPVIGNIQVYLDDNHLSASFLASLSPVLARRLLPALTH
ncbi:MULTISPECIES: acyltransferase family protein [unclassified Crossiella]|uniref:acyltransferase family protein n=1 Tax=unclassified Crossiella TaxID=2620835 RepID=UPI001FFE50EB|nr:MULTISPECIES: acyltransferase family protein [unclassified Crossiella]MCK2243023.1 acyltransferase [Crossiella sp. S99.2]MCK2256900.1 acyltransferase [Crossiella sp. S99.1]